MKETLGGVAPNPTGNLRFPALPLRDSRCESQWKKACFAFLSLFEYALDAVEQAFVLFFLFDGIINQFEQAASAGVNLRGPEFHSLGRRLAHIPGELSGRAPFIGIRPPPVK